MNGIRNDDRLTSGSDAVIVAEGLRRAKMIDLSKIEMKLKSDEGELCNLTEFELKLAISLYREFLALHCIEPDHKVVPTKLIDSIWHAHILDTRAYANDCNVLYGEFLHHYPYFGLSGPEDAKNLVRAYAKTCDLWHHHFGHRPDHYEDFDNSARCANACSSCSR